MISLSAGAVLVLLATFLYIVLPLARNIRIANASRIPYVIVPYYTYNRLTARFMARTWMRLVDKFAPSLSTTAWRQLVTPQWVWKLRYAPFKRLNTDTFLTVAPGGIILNTADANVITQIFARPDDFPKATHLYSPVEIFGKNVVSTTGEVWRHHRAATGPAFTEKNNQLVWEETLGITRALLDSWTGKGPEGGNKTIDSVAGDTMRLSLEVIGRAGLGQKSGWPNATEALPTGHTMSFTAAVQYLLANMVPVVLFPKWFLRNFPSKGLNRAHEAYVEWGNYMKEMIAEKKDHVQSAPNQVMDLVGQLLKSQQGNYGNSRRSGLTDSEVVGNLFMFMIAGHETSANSIHFCLLLLALHPQAQRKVQKELEGIFQGRPISEWDYERDIPALLKGYLGAILNEELRLIAPTISVPKISSSEPQHLAVDGKDVTVPANTMIRICIHAAHRNPKFWPRSSPEDRKKASSSSGNVDNDLDEFKPERWLPEKRGGSLYTPVKGSFLPFSDGSRACLGKRFAQVEIMAALAVIFSHYSVELAVDEWATDEEVEKMTNEERRATWKKAEDKGNWILQHKMVGLITLQLRGGHVPVRFVRKGEERFGY